MKNDKMTDYYEEQQNMQKSYILSISIPKKYKNYFYIVLYSKEYGSWYAYITNKTGKLLYGTGIKIRPLYAAIEAEKLIDNHSDYWND